MDRSDATFVSILPSFKGFFSEVESKSAQAGKTAGQTFAQSMERNLEKAQRAADKAAGVLERAQVRAANSADATRVAELKLQEVREKASAKASEIASAEARVEKARRAQETANKAVERASKGVADAQDRVVRATKEASGELDSAADNVDNFSSSISDGVKQLGAFAAGVAGVAGLGALASDGMAVSGAISQMNNQLGFTGAVAANMGAEVDNVMRSGVAGSAEVAAGAIGSLQSQFKYLGFEGEQTSEQLADNFIAFSETFGVDIAEATQTAGQLIKNDLATDVEQAADLMTAAMQRVPAQMRDELPEIINEYGTNFRALGFSGEEAFALLVSASEKGKWALDKTGDALKEFTIRGSDMSAASVEAYQAIGLNAEEMSNKIASGGADARSALEQTAQGILAIEDPAERANTAIALFGTPLEDLSVDQIPQFLDSLTGAGGGLDGFAGSSQRLADSVKNSLDGRLNALKGTVSSLAGDAFMYVWDIVSNNVIPAFEAFGGWVQRNEAWVGPLAAAVGAAAVAWGLWTAAIKAWEVATKIATAVQTAFNAVMAANPIMLVVMAIAAVTAGLVYFFTQTETGKAVWQSFMDALGAAWTWLQGVFTPFFQWLGGVITGVWNGIKAGWDLLWQGIQLAWTSVLLPVLTALWNVAQFTIGLIGTIILAPLLLAWQALSWGIKLAWETIIKPAWDALMLAAQWMWTNVLMPIFGFIGDAWAAMVNGIQFVYNSILKPTWDALQNAARWMYDNALKPIFQWIGDRWNDMSRLLDAGRRFIVDTVFAGIQRGLDVVKNAFQAAKDGIGRIWNGLKAVAARPVKFVIDTVWNNGILKAWNLIAKFLPGIDKVEEFKPAWLGQYARGGVLPGYTPGRDVHDFYSPSGGRIRLSGGEAIMRPEWTRAVGGPAAVEEMNRRARKGELTKHGKESAAFATGGVLDLGRFASGGVVAAMTRIVQQKYPMLQMTSGLRPGDGGMHGAGLAADFSNGSGNTPAQLALAKDIAKTYPGSAELIYDAPGWAGNIKNGQNVGAFGGFYNMAQAGPHHHHVHWAMTVPPTMPFGGGVFKGGSSGGGAGGGFGGWIANKARGIWDKIVKPIKGGLDKFAGGLGDTPFAKIPGAAFEKLESSAWEKISSFFGVSSGNGPGSMGGGVERWRGLVQKILRAKGLPLSLTNTTLRRMNQESGGDPGAINNWDSNAAAGTPSKGLMQVIDPTFQAHKDPGFNDIWDPEANIRASMNYALATYGSLPAAYDRAGGYDAGGYLQPGVTRVQNDSGKPEPVFSHSQWADIRASIWSKAKAQQWQSAVDEMVEAAELFANGAREIGRRAEVDARRWAAGEHIMLSDKERLATPREMGDQVGYWAGSELAAEVAGIFGFSNTTSDALLEQAGFTDPGLTTSGRVAVEAQTVEVSADTVEDPAVPEGVQPPAPVGEAPASTVADPAAASGETTEDEPSGGYTVTIENVTINGGATEADGRAFIKGIRDEVDGLRVRGRLSRVN